MSRRLLFLVLALAAQGALPGAVRAQAQPLDRPQDPAAVQQVAQDYLLQQLSSLPAQPNIQIDEVRTDRLPACDALTAYTTGPMRPRARMSVGVRCTAPKPWNVYVQASVSLPGQYFVAARPINAGETLQMNDLAPRDGDLINLPPGAITDPQSVIGMTASYRIGMGQPIRATNLRSAGSVQRGQMVRITARGAGFVVSSEGQVMQNAAPGSTVEVKTSSGQIVSGILQPQGNVEVPL
ncbi:MAG TPA: flagellar basal body P-ring formation chaperone FlgA [Bordetella sp.]|jgi:flagella basal body P-ring formation protein FlgA|nr:flagellar basal body P-ring formation chaperone FlgA [Bordetella sp.]